MRCLGRVVSLVILLTVLGVGWLYRDEVRHKVESIVDPMSDARRSGTPAPEALATARERLERIGPNPTDSVLLTPGELGSLMLEGLGWSNLRAIDSLRVEVDLRSLTVSGRVATDSFTSAIRDRVPISLAPYEKVSLTGDLNPGRPGMAEWRLTKVTLHGVPLPAGLISRLLRETGAPASDGRFQIPLPKGVSTFQVRRDGAVFYGGSGR